MFTHEKELKNLDQVRIKISQFTGVVVRTKSVTASMLEVLLEAIDQDAALFMAKQAQQKPSIKLLKQNQPEEMGGLSGKVLAPVLPPSSGIVNLRFEDCHFHSKAVAVMKQFFQTKHLIETVTL